ncbi:MAG: trypsin-like peptidase domain-containing protein [Pirellulales bacterium]|nr:trypsin-like peptidase domain-containing protein [Pirellulales bacterium]
MSRNMCRPHWITIGLLIWTFLAACLIAFLPAIADTVIADTIEVDPFILQAESQRIAVMQKAAPTVVAIFEPDGKGGGSGVVISPDGFALTNYHVVQPCGKSMKCGMADGRIYDAVLVGIDPTGDVALIKLFGRDDFPLAKLADSDLVRVGDAVFAMGNPFLLSTDLQPTISWGIISGTHRYQFPAGTLLEYADCFQTDAAVNPGNSGGPLFNDRAEVIGINGRCSFEKRGRVSVGVGYAISINQIKNFLGYLHSGRIVDHATLGATVAFDAGGWVTVDDILEDSDAYRRGLRYGDEIVRFAGRTVDSPNAMKNILGTLPKGWRVPLSFRREGKRHDVLVRLSGVHRQSELLEKIKAKQGMPSPGRPMPKRPGDDKKHDEKDDGKGAPRPEKPPENKPRVPAEIPKIVQDNFQKKHGYANYYFNLTNRKRVFADWAARAGLKWPEAAAKAWKIEARTRSEKQATITLDSKSAAIRAGDKTFEWNASTELATEGPGPALTPPGSGGLLPALYLWHRLATQGPDAFGEVYYVGTAPLAGSRELFDVVAGLTGDLECRCYFDRKNHDLAALELFAEEGSDPCELYLQNYRKTAGRWMPSLITAHYGDEVFETFSIGSPQAKNNVVKDNNGGRLNVSQSRRRFSGAVDVAFAKVVKIRGAGGFRGMEDYQSGLLISPDGHVLTALSSALDTDEINITLDDGRLMSATLVGADPGLDVALLKIEGKDFPFFDLTKGSKLEPGSRVLALSNLFGVAVGNEPVSAQRGVVSVNTRLVAGRGVFETPYHGPTYVLDASTNNPGAAGGALLDREGRLAGMLGKELQNKLNRTWLNYAIPTAELKKSADSILSGRFTVESRPGRKKASKPITLEQLGIALVPNVLYRTPPYVDSVRNGSAAAKVGLRADDLIVLVGDRLVQSCRELEDELSYIPVGSVLYLTVMREHELVEIGVE